MKKILPILISFLPILQVFAQDTIQNENCKAYFKYELKDMLMSPLPAMAVQFYGAAEGDVDSWFWEFDDGETSREQDPMHVYYADSIGADGSFLFYRTVKLTIYTADSCISTYTEAIQVFHSTDPRDDCRAYFQYYQTNYDTVNNTATIQFKGISDNDSLQYSWDFGNGEMSAARNPEIVFDLSSKEYQVCLETAGRYDCSDSYCETIVIKNPYAFNDSADCFAGFVYKVNYDVQTFAPALVLDFYSQSKNAMEWHWDFDDGTTSDEPNPMHIFNLPLDPDSAGNAFDPYRNVCLTVVTKSGCGATSCETINILMNDTIKPEPHPEPECQAWIKYYKRDDIISIPELVQYRFVDASEGEVASRLWTFEDGTTSTDEVVDKGFDFMKQTQKVCLTIETLDSCISTWCETVRVSNIPPDSGYVPVPSPNYSFRYEAYFPIGMSSCAGTVKAWVYHKDSLVDATNFVWSNGAEGQEAEGFCPTQTYSVKAITPDGTVVSGTFVFNGDSTVSVIPMNWWVSDSGDLIHVSADKTNEQYVIRWKLCDGTVLVQDSIPVELLNCDGSESNMFLTDSAGVIIYSENISMKAISTVIDSKKLKESIQLFPNPVNDILNLQYKGNSVKEMQVEINDITGKQVLNRFFYNIQNGQKLNIDTSSLKKGIYIVQVRSENQILTQQKIIK